MSKLRDVGNQEEMMAKDKAEERRIFREMLSGMTTAERNSLITKDKLFPSIHYQAESEKGKDRTVLYFMKKYVMLCRPDLIFPTFRMVRQPKQKNKSFVLHRTNILI